MPIMSPIPIPTKDKGFIDAIILWLWEPRHWKIEEDFHYSINGDEYIVPKDFEFDGASVPRLLWFFLLIAIAVGSCTPAARMSEPDVPSPYSGRDLTYWRFSP